tara:strand:- start:628 stop:1017 length:390 start_codon:yes stop_codon:yes gene_type:complete
MVQPIHKPTTETRTTVSLMSAYGIPQEVIIKAVGIESSKTLRKYYSEEIEEGLKMASVTMAQALYDKGMGKKLDGDTKAMMFWLERVGGDMWKQNQKVEVTSQDYTIEMSPVIEYLDRETKILNDDNTN